MPDRHLPDGRLSRFDSIETETLRRILREKGKNPAKDPHMEDTLYIIELLARREQDAEKSPESPQGNCPGGKRKRPGMPGLIAAAAALVILAGIAINAKGLWESIIRWSGNSFSLSPPSAGNQDEPSSATEEAPEGFPEVSALLPSWFPEDYIPGETSLQQSPAVRVYRALFTGPRGSIQIRIGDYLAENPMQYEYSQGLLEIYEVDGIQYYICRNYDALRAVWLADQCECAITGNITLEEMKQMIDSIGS